MKIDAAKVRFLRSISSVVPFLRIGVRGNNFVGPRGFVRTERLMRQDSGRGLIGRRVPRPSLGTISGYRPLRDLEYANSTPRKVNQALT